LTTPLALLYTSISIYIHFELRDELHIMGSLPPGKEMSLGDH
jgi:hypothetical protein